MSAFTGADIVETNLILCVDAANPRSYPGTGTTWTDVSGNGNNGTLTNGPTYSSNNGGYIIFDGSNDYISSTSISSLLTGDMTAEAWIYLTSSSTDYVRIVGTGVLSGGNRTFGLWYDNTGRLLWQRYSSDPSLYPSSPTITTGTWYHVVATTSGSSHALYLNGDSIGTSTASGPWTASGEAITMGYAGIHTYHNGRISNVKLYTRGLTATEVRQNFTALRGRYGL